MVELSVQVKLVPLEASVSKFSVSGVPSAVMLPLFVSADEGGIRDAIPTANKIVATTASRIKRDRDTDWGAKLDMKHSSLSY